MLEYFIEMLKHLMFKMKFVFIKFENTQIKFCFLKYKTISKKVISKKFSISKSSQGLLLITFYTRLLVQLRKVIQLILFHFIISVKNAMFKCSSIQIKFEYFN